MNSLSWLIYLADISERSLALFSFLAFMGGLVLFLLGVGYAIAGAHTPDDSSAVSFCKAAAPWLKYGTPVWVLLLIVSIALPNKKTIYLIAASELGERVVTSEPVSSVAKDANDILRAYLDKAKKELLPEKSK